MVARQLVENEDQGCVDINTGLFSSRFFKTIIAKQIQSFERYQTFFSIVLISLPEKTIKEASSVLKEIASFIRSHVRVVDEIGSSGKGQFCVLLPHTMESGANLVGERIKIGLLDYLETHNLSSEIEVEVLCVPENLAQIRELADSSR